MPANIMQRSKKQIKIQNNYQIINSYQYLKLFTTVSMVRDTHNTPIHSNCYDLAACHWLKNLPSKVLRASFVVIHRSQNHCGVPSTFFDIHNSYLEESARDTCFISNADSYRVWKKSNMMNELNEVFFCFKCIRIQHHEWSMRWFFYSTLWSIWWLRRFCSCCCIV